jgi:hypothetical protein
MTSAIEGRTRLGRNGKRLTSSASVEPVSTSTVSRPASMPATTSVSIRSPTIVVDSECASIRFIALRNIIGFGLPTKYGSDPVALVIIAATDPVAGSGPSGEGPVTSGLVAMKRAPLPTSRIARVIASNEYVRVSPRTT